MPRRNLVVILTVHSVQELANSTFQIPIVGIECRACTGLAGRWRLTSDTVPDPLRLLARSNLLFCTKWWAAAITVSARLTIVRILWRDVDSEMGKSNDPH
jgi:hypothetical protein